MSDNNKGQFKPGQSGNPGGRPKGYGEVRELARAHTEKAIDVLASIMYDEKAAATARQAAAEALLNRGWGKPETTVNVGGQGSSWIEALRQISQQRAPENKQETGEAAVSAKTEGES
jgi:hypothetical protein